MHAKKKNEGEFEWMSGFLAVHWSRLVVAEPKRLKEEAVAEQVGREKGWGGGVCMSVERTQKVQASNLSREAMCRSLTFPHYFVAAVDSESVG